MDFSRFEENKYSRKDFEFQSSLGRSATSRVERVKHIKENTEYALKIFEKFQISTTEKYERLVTEKEMLTKCDHPGILKLFGVFSDAEFIYFVLEYCSFGDFERFLSRFESFPFELIRFYSGELVSVLTYLNSLKVVHGNLKPRNILVSGSLHIKITDFNTIKPGNKRQISSVMSADYVSPELLDEGEYGVPSDMWALGCIIYQMLEGSPPFVSATQYSTFDKIRSGNINFPLFFPPFAVDLVQSLLLLDPQLRIGVSDIEELNTHIFFQGLDIQRIFSLTPPDYSNDLMPEPALESKTILKDVVKKKCGWVYKKRILEIMEKPSILYYEPVKNELRGGIEISPQLRAEAKNNTDFHIITPKRVYFFKAITGTSEVWVNSVNELVNKVYG